MSVRFARARQDCVRRVRKNVVVFDAAQSLLSTTIYGGGFFLVSSAIKLPLTQITLSCGAFYAAYFNALLRCRFRNI